MESSTRQISKLFFNRNFSVETRTGKVPYFPGFIHNRYTSSEKKQKDYEEFHLKRGNDLPKAIFLVSWNTLLPEWSI